MNIGKCTELYVTRVGENVIWVGKNARIVEKSRKLEGEKMHDHVWDSTGSKNLLSIQVIGWLTYAGRKPERYPAVYGLLDLTIF